MTEPITYTVAAPGAVLIYDVREPGTPSEHRPLFIFGSPMGASGFEQLARHFDDRVVITYDPRGMERSTRGPDSELTAEVHAEAYHRVVEAARVGAVDAFGSSGGGMCALHWVVAHPEDVRILVSHEPPLAIGALGEGGLARRGGQALAALFGVEPVIFPGDHAGFAANEWSPDNDPAAFAATLRELLDTRDHFAHPDRGDGRTADVP